MTGQQPLSAGLALRTADTLVLGGRWLELDRREPTVPFPQSPLGTYTARVVWRPSGDPGDRAVEGRGLCLPPGAFMEPSKAKTAQGVQDSGRR